MKNPNGPYPGRQLFLGITLQNKPILAYLITGRSPESRERRGILVENTIRIGPIGNQPYDPLRHYSAVKYDNTLGIAAVSNGIQTDAIFETYKLLLNTNSLPRREYMEQILDGAGAEPDSYHTPRIAGIVTYTPDKPASPVFIIGMKGNNSPAMVHILNLEPGIMIGISTYKGLMENPEARKPEDSLAELEFKVEQDGKLARTLFDISSADYKGNDIRVCAIGGVCSERQNWNFSIVNVHQ
jgi:IMP cyclohydrolase